MQRAVATFRDYEAGHQQALTLVHDILRAADLSSPSNVLSTVAEVASLTQQAMTRPYTNSQTVHTTAPAPVPVPNTALDPANITVPQYSPPEGVLVIDLPSSQSNSDPSQYSDSGSVTINYASDFDDISD